MQGGKQLKKLLILLGIFFLLVGCSKGESNSNYQQLKDNPQVAEDTYITETIENLTTLKGRINELKPLFTNADPTNSTWIVDVNYVLNRFPTINKQLSERYLNAEQKEKYSKTIIANEEALAEIESIQKDIKSGMKDFDNETLIKFYSRLSNAETLIQTTLDTLDEEKSQ
jgi:hypothetical protein